MEKVSNNRTRSFVAAIVVLGLIVGVLTFGYIGSTVAMASYSTQLENVYQRSFYELLTDVNNIEVNLSKALISTGNGSRQKIYDNINDACTQASENLSRLPINHESVTQTTTFINQLGGFSYYVSEKLKNGTSLSTADYNSTEELHTMCLYIQSILNDFINQYSGNYSILQTTKGNSSGNSFSTMFGNMQAQGVEYPTLIYDGPFSDSQVNREVKGLTGSDITQQEALSKVEQIYEGKNISNLKFDSETNGIFKTYNFTLVNEQGRNLYIQIAKKGGFLLTISSYSASDADELTLAQCEQKAKEFVNSAGLSLESVWSTKITGMAYVNLTPVVNGVIIYPDMIKVKVSCSTGEVLGYEAQSYAYNHVARTGLNAEVSEATARTKVSSRLTIVTQKIALIPDDFGKEKLCYEYKCTLSEAEYYVYISAKTGEEVKILKVISTTDGNLLM